MTETAASSKYAPPQILLHWLIALLIFGLYALGLSVDSFAKPDRPMVVNLHAIFGLLTVVLLLARIVAKRLFGAPAYPSSMGPLFQKAATSGHAALYLMMILVPAIGLRAFLFRGQPLNFGLFQIPALYEGDREIAHQAHHWHELAAHLLMALVVGHVIVALYHQFVMRDGLLARMKMR